MFVRFGKVLVVVALVVALDAQWAVLQTVAWTTMLANNLRTYSLAESVARTFDGKYPCPICKAIAAAKKSQKESKFTAQMKKLEFPPASERFVLVAPTRFELLPKPAYFFGNFLTQEPPVPPPRGFFV